jgi:hypothetical protein
MSRRKDKERLGDFVPLIRSTTKTPAWRAMSRGARSLYAALKARYNTRLHNGMFLSARVGAEELGSCKDYVARWHYELQHYGFYRAGNLVWHGLKLHLRMSDRVLAVLNADPEYPNLYRVHYGVDQISDVINQTRAKDAAVSFALAALNGEAAVKQQKQRRVPS